MTFTHYGWFGFCPVKLGDIESDGPLMEPRWAILEPVFWLSCQVQQWVVGLCSLCFEDYEPGWRIHITGEIK